LRGDGERQERLSAGDVEPRIVTVVCRALRAKLRTIPRQDVLKIDA